MRSNAAALSLIVKAEMAGVAALLELLCAEQDALLKGDSERLGPLVEAKGRHLAALHDLSGQRLGLLQREGRSPARASIDAWILEHSAVQPDLLEDWRGLMGSLRTANQLNHTNGELVAARLRVTQQALGVLFPAGANHGTYDAGGSAVAPNGPRQLAVA